MKAKGYYVSVAAEAIAAALFARARCEVSVQYGANQPGYDLIIARDRRIRKVSVKGSEDGGWVLVAGHKNEGVTYHEAISNWLQCHPDLTVLYCFVQFRDCEFAEMPRLYLATCEEVAVYLTRSRAGHGYTSVRESHEWQKGIAVGTIDVIPAEWAISLERITKLLDSGPATCP